MGEIIETKNIKLTPKSFALVLGLILGGFIRLAPVLSASFPIKDGGLFSVFIDEILNNHFSLPNSIAYNGLTIPFAYPPLSFYLTAILSLVLNISSIELIKLLPALFSILTIPAFYWLASTFLESDRQVCFAVLSFALLPTAVDFMIVGGGLPRSLGYLFAMLALQQTWLLFTHSDQQRHLGWSILWTSVTFLTHPVVAKFLIYSLVVIFLFKGRSRRGLFQLAGIGFGAVLLTSPWWLTVISRHGISPFFNAMQAAPQSWTSYLAAFLFMQTNEPYLHIQGLLALIGIFFCLNKRIFWLPSWLALVFFLEPRLVASYAILPTALLVGVGLDLLVKSLSTHKDVNHETLESISDTPGSGNSLIQASKIMLGFFLVYAIVSAFISAPRQFLSVDNREAMMWIKNNLPANSQFLVISGINGPGEDYISEWFPVLTGSTSLATPQGMEWISGRDFSRLWQNHDQLQTCGGREVVCLEEWAEENQEQLQFVYLNKSLDGTEFIENSLDESGFDKVFENDEVTVFSYNQK